MSLRTRKVDAKSRVVLPDRFAGKLVVIDQVDDNEVRIRVSKRRPLRYSLDQLLAESAHTDFQNELDVGPPLGAEVHE